MAADGQDNIDSIFSQTDLDEIEAMLIASSKQSNSETEATNKPVLKHTQDVINGIIPVQIENFWEIFPEIDFSTTTISFTLSFKFNFPNKNKHYTNNEWQFTKFNDVTQDLNFWIKVPLFLLPYLFEFILTISLMDIQDMTEKQRVISTLYSTKIPSILIGTGPMNIGDSVQYRIENAAHVGAGIITKVLQNDMFEIKTTEYEYDNVYFGGEIITIDKSEVCRDAVDALFIVDVTNTAQAYIDLILGLNEEDENETKERTFYMINECLLDIYCNNMWYNDEIDYEEYDAETMSVSMCIYIFEFLYCSKYYHRINCIFDGCDMIHEMQWPYYVGKHIENVQKGIETADAQIVWECGGYSCDLCRIEVKYFEYMWHCDNGDHEHDFCLSCIHSVLQQFYEMKNFIIELLDGVINRDCVEEIIAFCVGKVNTFDVSQKMLKK
eukprot:425875_1